MAEPHDGTPEDVPQREIRDPQVLRAMAHPVRISIVEQLAMTGAATATELSEQIGESAANCSWHLRQLAKYGFVEEAEGGTGRQRPWRLVAQSTRVPASDHQTEQEFTQASDALMDVMLGRELEALRAWQSTRNTASEAWRDASFATQSWDFLTVEELAELRRELMEVLERTVLRHADRIDPARRPPGAQPIRFVAWAFPAVIPGKGDEEPTGVD
jgi:DNA-binding transcriptional ArsR family regulator